MRIEEQLQELGRDLPIPHVDPTASLASVTRRGRVRLWFTRGVTVAMTLTSGVAAAVVVPQVVDRPTAPTVMGEVEGVTVAPAEDVEGEKVEEPKDEVVPPAVDAEPSPSEESKAVDEPVAADTTPPEIVVLHPEDGATFEERTIAFEGEVEPGARVFAGSYEADVSDSGAWRIVLVLAKGRNEVTFTAKDAAGNRATDHVVVHYAPPAADAVDVRFTATQVHASKTYDPPYTYYEGTAAPGSVVKVTSEYGSAATEASAKGHWEVKVWFEAAPAGTHSWPVTVTSKATGETKRFEFTGTRPEAADLHLTANQKWGVIDAPFENVYWGTATPGKKVKVLSDYGWASTTADAEGHWELGVVFDPPAGEKTFAVHVKLWDHPEVARTFELTTVRESAQAFTVDWFYETCSSEPPYQEAAGKAEPGSQVVLWASTGDQMTVTADSQGNWYGKLILSGAPKGKRTEVDLKAKSVATGDTVWFYGYVVERPA